VRLGIRVFASSAVSQQSEPIISNNRQSALFLSLLHISLSCSKRGRTELRPLELRELLVRGEQPLHGLDVLFPLEAREVVEVDLRLAEHPTGVVSYCPLPILFRPPPSSLMPAPHS
jgi:hypothetical protein